MKPTKPSPTSTPSKKPRSAGLSVLVYDRPLHPELFAVEARRVRFLGEFEVSMWLLAGGGHTVTICGAGTDTITELACFPNKSLPDRGLIERLPCKGDKQFDKPLGDKHHYYLAINEEHITEALYENSVIELQRLADDQDGLLAQRKDENGRTECMSLVVAQLHRRAVHIEGFHLLGEARVLVRTQSIIEPIRG
ncbi:MAG: DUF2617 family protein [Phycisphaerae bacterium]